MAWFEYTGLTPGGTAIAGRIDAADSLQAREDLARMQVDVREIQRAERPTRSPAILSQDDLIFFNGQLASLAQAGIALDEGLAQLARDIRSRRFRGWLEGLVQDLRAGMSIDQAIARREAGLPVLYSSIIRAGVESGDLPAVLLNLNQHLQLAGNTRRLLWEAASYPLIVLLLAMTVLSVVFTLLIPQFGELFSDFGVGLPALTVFTLAAGRCFARGGWAVMWLTPVVLALAWESLRYLPHGVNVRERILLELPVIGKIHTAALVARFLRAIATAVATGIPLPQAIRLSAAATGNRLMQRDAERLASEIERGESIFVAGQSTRIIPPLFGFCVQVALGREALPDALNQLARSYENRAVNTQSLLRTLLFPILILFIGGIVGFVIVAMFLPLIALINSVSSGGA